MSDRRNVLKSAASISLATMLSRVLGLVRDQVQSYFFGAGTITDAFLAAFRIPNLLRDLFAEGALSSAFVPTFTAEREHHGASSAWALANRVMTTLVVLLGIATLLIAGFAPWIVRVYVAGFEPDKIALTVTMTRIVSPFLLFVALAAVAMGVLNTCGRFFLPALAPAWFNVCFIASIVLLPPWLVRAGWHPGLALAWGALIGGVLQFGVQIPAMRREGFRFRLRWEPSDAGLRRVGRLMLPAVFGLAATQINILVDTVLASFSSDGAITWLALAFRLIQLPIGLFGVALATANLARVSQDAARGDHAALRANLATSLRAAALLTLPATAGLIVLREPVVRLLFQHGEFSPESTVHTAAAILCYSVGLYAYSVTKVQVPTFYALGDTRRPVLASATAVLLKIGVNLVFLALLPREHLFLGLALSTSLAAWVNMTLLARGLNRHIGSLREHAVMSSSVKLGGLAAVMGIACAIAHALLERWLPGAGIVGNAGRILVTVALGVAIVAYGVQRLDVPERGIVTAILRRLVASDRNR